MISKEIPTIMQLIGCGAIKLGDRYNFGGIVFVVRKATNKDLLLRPVGFAPTIEQTLEGIDV